MDNLKESFLKLRERMLDKFKEDFKKHLELGEKEIPIKSIGPINGVYFERGEKTYFIRPRIRAGIMSLKQMKKINDLAMKYGDGEIKLTTRQGVQIRGIRSENVFNVINGLGEVELYTQAVGGKSIRGMTVSSYSGFEEEEFDVISYAVKSTDYLIQNEDTYKLPGKLKFAISNNEKDSGNAKYSDMGFIARNIDGENYFDIYFDFGLNLSMKNPYKYSKRIKAEEMVYYMRATVMMFIENMDMKNPRARLRTMNRIIGKENFEGKYREYLEKAKKEIDSIISLKDLYSGTDKKYKSKSWAKEIEKENIDDKDINVKMFRNIKECFYQKGIYAVTLKYQGGVIRKGGLLKLIDYLENLSHDIRIKLTNNQNIIIFDLNGDEVVYIMKNFKEILMTSDLEESITCTGTPRCRLALTSSKAIFSRIIKEFNEKNPDLKSELPVLRISGCPNSCSLTFKGDLGFSGRMKTVDEEKKIAYTLLSENKKIIHAGKAVIPEDKIPKLMIELAETKRNSEIEDFHEFVERKSEEVNRIIEKYM